MRRAGAALRILAALVGTAAIACAEAPRPDPQLVVGTSGDYAPFSHADAEGALSGFDLTVARAFARDAGLALSFVRFAWPDLAEAVADGRFEVAMSGVTVRPERSVRGRFSLPVATSGAVALVRRADAAGGLAGLDRPGVRIGVNAGGHLERVARASFTRATLVPFLENDAVRRAMASGAVRAVVTDTGEAPRWERTLGQVVRLGPFTRDRKAYLWSVDAVARAESLDAWLLAREADGSLARWRAHWLGAPGPETATPLSALLSALGERLSLMPLVAESKRAAGLAVRDRAREAAVLDAAFRDVARRAAERGVAAPDRDRVVAFYRAQIEAAVAIQATVLARPAGPDSGGFDLERELRPALLRLGDRIAWALVRIEDAPGRDALGEAVGAELANFGLGAGHADPLADALLALAQDLAKARARSPAITGSANDTP